MNIVKRMLAATAVLMGLASPAAALDTNTAAAVVTIMEQISDGRGEGVYYGGGDAFFDLDDAGLIAAAGFGRSDWSAAFDEVVTGYMATIPQDEFDAMFREIIDMLDASAVDDTQKAELRQDIVVHIAEAQRARESGMQHAQAVLPFADRLYPMFFGE